MSPGGIQGPNERLIEAALTKRLDSIVPGRDLWPSVRAAVLQPRPRFTLRRLTRVFAVTGIVAAIIILGLTRPWQDNTASPLSPFTVVAEAYEGLLSLETVHYRIEGQNNQGSNFVHLNQVDMVNKIRYSAFWLDTDPDVSPPSSEQITIGGKSYDRRERLPGAESLPGWRFRGEIQGWWAPFEELGGLPWGGKDTLGERFDEVERLPDNETNSVKVEHYLATRLRETESRETYRDTVEIWVRAKDRLLEKVDWLHQERWSPPGTRPDTEINLCEGLDGYPDMEVLYGTPGSQHFFPGPPAGDVVPVQIWCRSKDRIKNQVAWRVSAVPL